MASLDDAFDLLYAADGRPSIAPERLIRARLIQILFSVRSERRLMEQMQYNLLFRWFVGLEIDDPVWVPAVLTKNRDRECQEFRVRGGHAGPEGCSRWRDAKPSSRAA